jgi:hypothetical protein
MCDAREGLSCAQFGNQASSQLDAFYLQILSRHLNSFLEKILFVHVLLFCVPLDFKDTPQKADFAVCAFLKSFPRKQEFIVALWISAEDLWE